MSKRKAIPASVQVSLAIMQGGQGIACPLCDGRIWSGDRRILEHMTPHATMVALGRDPNEFDNLRWVHAACADRKTNGTKATTAGSDKHMIAKGNRFDRVNAGLRSRKRKGPKIKSRGFAKVHRPFRRAERG